MTGKIALEEHFALAETLGDSERYFPPAVWQRMYGALTDIQEKRLAEMDQHGIETAILSLNSPAIQGIHETRRAIEVARIANDFLAEQVAKNPPRFQGFAGLAMQDPDEAARELTRCVKELGFRGAMVNGFSHRRFSRLLRSSAIRSFLGDGGATRRAVLFASARPVIQPPAAL
jgi:2,3-dihydroxybenzoate decarboxylase